MPDFQSILHCVGVVLRDNEELRTIDKRMAVWKKVKEDFPEANYNTVDRSCRKIQNSFGMHKPACDDGRFQLSKQYEDFFIKE